MSWTRGLLAVLAVCVLLLTGSAGCGSGSAQGNGTDGTSSAPVGELLEDTDQQGRPYREVDEEGAPGLRIEVQPAAGDTGWDVRLVVRDFRFSPVGAKPEAVAGRGIAKLFVDGRPVAELRTPDHRLSGRYVAHGTHHVTARLYADDGTVWAVDGEPVESTADITASEPEPTGTTTGVLGAPGVAHGVPGTPGDVPGAPGATAHALGANAPRAAPPVSNARRAPLPGQGRGFPDRGGKAS